jgi:hypothetical protein
MLSSLDPGQGQIDIRLFSKLLRMKTLRSLSPHLTNGTAK